MNRQRKSGEGMIATAGMADPFISPAPPPSPPSLCARSRLLLCVNPRNTTPDLHRGRGGGAVDGDGGSRGSL